MRVGGGGGLTVGEAAQSDGGDEPRGPVAPEGSGVPRTKIRPPPASGIRRQRLTGLLIDGSAGLRLVQGAAGSGKTTVLAHAAEAWPGRVIWVTVDGTDRGPRRFGEVITTAVGIDRVGTTHATSPEAALEVVQALEGFSESVMLVVDDVHELGGSPSAEALALLCRYRPEHVTLVFGARHLRGLDHWRWRSSPNVREIDGNALRFRLWEVDNLFRDHYGTPLGADELHAITQLTDGWAVALHLYRLAAKAMPTGALRQLVARPRRTTRSIREYLEHEVLAGVTGDRRRLLRRVAVFDSIRPALCDRLTTVGGSADALRELADHGLVSGEADGTAYRLHDLLRAQLLAELEEELGLHAVARLHRQAAEALEESGHLTEAVRAFGRAGDWDNVRRLMARQDAPAIPTGPWADTLPDELRDTDPWVLRATARRLMCDGELGQARATLSAAIERFREQGGDRLSEHELRLLDGWLTPDPGQRRTWTECLRAALAGESVEAWPDVPEKPLAAGLADLAVGRVTQATASLTVAARDLDGELGAMAELGLSLAAVMAGQDGVATSERALSCARAVGAGVLVRLAELLSGWAEGSTAGLGEVVAADDPTHDNVGNNLHSLIVGLSLLSGGRNAEPALAAATEGFERAGLGVLAGLGRASALLDQARNGSVTADAVAAGVVAARAVGPLPYALALLASETVEDDRSRGHRARALARQHGFGGLFDLLGSNDGEPAAGDPQAEPTADGTTDPADGSLSIECLGQLRIAVGGAPCDLDQLRPLHQDLLRLLVVQANEWVHRERLIEWLWPDSSPDKATRNLQVAISSIRKVLDPEAAAGRSTVLTRNGECYRIEVDESNSDLCRVRAALAASRDAGRDGDIDRASDRLSAAFAEWQGELVPAAGPADWAVEMRRQLAHEVGSTSLAVVRALTEAEQVTEAAQLAARAVELDPSNDALWNQAISAARAAGSSALATELDNRYQTLVGTE